MSKENTKEENQISNKASVSFFKNILKTTKNNVGIDLGSAFTVSYVEDVGTVWNEPTLITLNTVRNQVVSIGKKARVMMGRTPEHYKVIQPVQEGVISDYEITTHYIENVLKKIQTENPKLLGPTVVVGVPCDAQNAEINALKDSVLEAGAREVYVVHEPFAAAVAIGGILDRDDASMIIDIGGGTSDVLVIASGEIIDKTTIRVAGNKFDKIIQEGLEREKNLHVGVRTAEDLKIAIMSEKNLDAIISVQGRSVSTGLPLEIEISLEEVLTYMLPIMEDIAEHVKEFVSSISPEILTDLNRRPIYFVGGGPLIKTFEALLKKRTGLDIITPQNHKIIVAMGNSIIANNPEEYKKYFI